MSRVVVVGNGMAGFRFVQDLLDRTDRFDLTVIGDEPGGAYNRVLLSNVLAGTTRPEHTTMATEAWYAARGVKLQTGVAAGAIDRGRRQVHLTDGSSVPYDHLVLATGSSAFVPPADGLRHPDGSLRPGVALFRTREDCAAIAAAAPTAGRAVIVGSGVLGLEAARALAGRGVPVTVLQREDRLMERQLDRAAGLVLARTLRRLGIEVVAGASVAAVTGTGAGDRLATVTLTDGRTLDAGLLVLCCGVRPRVELATAAGLDVSRGIVVDDRMRTSDPAITAVGECAEHEGRLYGLVAPVWEQARVAAAVVADSQAPLRYCGSIMITRLKAAGIELAAMGDDCRLDVPDAGSDGSDDSDDTGVEVITLADATRGIYQKLVVRDGRVAGAILLGDSRTVGPVTQLFERAALLPPDRAALLMARRPGTATAAAASPTALPARTTICQCNGVTKGAIVAAWQAGSRTVAEVADATRATTGCGTCRDAVCGLVDWLAEADTPAGRSA